MQRGWRRAAMTTPLATLFFPSSSPTASLLATLAVFAIAFVARPIGSILLGHVGDHYGRKPAPAIAVLHMALATFAMGLSHPCRDRRHSADAAGGRSTAARLVGRRRG
jgi:MFS family permease